jgi:hypothetical protein
VHVDVDLDVVAASVVFGGVLEEDGLPVALRGSIEKREGRKGGREEGGGGGREGGRGNPSDEWFTTALAIVFRPLCLTSSPSLPPFLPPSLPVR